MEMRLMCMGPSTHSHTCTKEHKVQSAQKKDKAKKKPLHTNGRCFSQLLPVPARLAGMKAISIKMRLTAVDATQSNTFAAFIAISR